MPGIRTMLVPAVAGAAILAACGQESPDAASEPDSSSEAVTSSANDSVPDAATETTDMPDQDESTVSDPAPEASKQPHVLAAIDDLAKRQGVQAEQVSVVELTEVTWADGAIGCPQPGMQYSQALVPGQLLTLAVAGAESADDPTPTFAYHAGRKGTFRYCANPQPPAMTGPGSGDS